jgi:hypothetical protein
MNPPPVPFLSQGIMVSLVSTLQTNFPKDKFWHYCFVDSFRSPDSHGSLVSRVRARWQENRGKAHRPHWLCSTPSLLPHRQPGFIPGSRHYLHVFLSVKWGVTEINENTKYWNEFKILSLFFSQFLFTLWKKSLIPSTDMDDAKNYSM